jgi:hypothetical protein
MLCMSPLQRPVELAPSAVYGTEKVTVMPVLQGNAPSRLKDIQGTTLELSRRFDTPESVAPHRRRFGPHRPGRLTSESSERACPPRHGMDRTSDGSPTATPALQWQEEIADLGGGARLCATGRLGAVVPRRVDM